MDQPDRQPAQPDREPTERWRTLPALPTPDTWVATVDDRLVQGAAEPAGDVDHEFMLRHAG